MRTRTLIRLPEHADAPAQAATLDEHGGLVHSQQAPLDALAAALDTRDALVLVPGTHVLITRAHVPARNRRQLQRAVPYALEDNLAEDIDALHFASGRAQGGEVPVAVVDHDKMRHWTQALEAAGIRPRALIPEPLALPWQPGQWHVLVDGTRFVMRTGPASGLSGDADNLGLLVRLAVQEAGPEGPQQLILHHTGEARPELEMGEVAVSEQRIDEPLSVLQGTPDSGIDLLQGPYSRREQLAQLWRPWRAAAGLLAAWLVLQLAADGVATWRLQQRSEALDRQIEQLFRETFPDAQRVVDARAQMEHRLDKLRGSGADSGYLRLIQRAGRVLATTSALELRRLTYRDGVLTLDLGLPSLQALDTLKQELSAQQGLSVEIASANAGGQRVDGRLVIREANA